MRVCVYILCTYYVYVCLNHDIRLWLESKWPLYSHAHSLVTRRSKAWRLRGSGDLRCAGRRELCGSNGDIGEFVN